MNARKSLSRKRICRLTFGFAGLVALVLLAGLSLPTLAQQATPAPTSSIDPVFLTATAIIGGATLTAQVAPPATATPIRSLDAVGLNPVFQTATAITGGATLTAQVIPPALPTSAANSTIDPIFLTATAIIAGATAIEQVNLALTGTPPPTLTSPELENLRLQWKAQLEEAVGFTHPVFDYITYARIVTHSSEDFSGTSAPIPVRRTTYQGIEYIAVIAQGIWDQNTIFLFKVQNDEPVLLDWNYEKIYLGYVTPLDDFADRNGNGYPDLALETNSGGSCPEIGLVMLEIQPDESVIDIPLPEANVLSLEDIDQDDLPEIKTSTFIHIPNLGICSPYTVTRWYKWNGTIYQNISATLDESSFPEIEAYWGSIKSQAGCLLPDEPMYQMLVAYISLHQLDKGWARLVSELHWEQCSPQTLREHGEAMGQLLQWVGTNLEASNSTP